MPGAEGGLQPNELAGVLLFFLPMSLVAIQGLYQQNQNLQTQTQTLQEENRLLKERLARLEQVVNELVQQRSL